MAVPSRPASGAPIESAWGSIAHDTAVAQDIQAGAVVVATTAVLTVDATVTFARPFASAPNVTVTAVGGSNVLSSLVSLPLPGSFVLRVFRRDGVNLPVGNTTVEWVAIGPRA